MMTGCFGGHPCAGGPEPAKKAPEIATPSSHTASSAHPAAQALQAGRLAVSFSGGGFLLPYHIGVVEVLLQLGVIRQRPPPPLPPPPPLSPPSPPAAAAAAATGPVGTHAAPPQSAANGSAAKGGDAQPAAPSAVAPPPAPPLDDNNNNSTPTTVSTPQPPQPSQSQQPSANATTATAATATAATATAANATNMSSTTASYTPDTTASYTPDTTASYTPIAGSSAGSLVAASLACGLTPAQMLSTFLDSVRDCRTGGSYRRLEQVLLRQLEESLPPNAHELCSGLATVGVTRLLPWPHIKRVSRFSSRSDLVAALLASCHIPRYFNGELFTSYRGKSSVDGGVTSLMPKSVAEHDFLLKVCCFPRRHVARLPVLNRAKALRLLDMGISPDAFGPWPHRLTAMLEHALHPSDDDFLVLLLQAGRGDAMRWAVSAGLAPPPLCRWVERWAAGLQQQQQPLLLSPSHQLADAAVAAAASNSYGSAAAAGGSSTDASTTAGAAGGRADVDGEVAAAVAGWQLEFHFMPIPPELLPTAGSATAAAEPSEQTGAAEPPAEAPGTPQLLLRPTATAGDASSTADGETSDGAAAFSSSTAAAAAPAGGVGGCAGSPALPQQQGGPTAVAEGLVSRTASSATAPSSRQSVTAAASRSQAAAAPAAAPKRHGLPPGRGGERDGGGGAAGGGRGRLHWMKAAKANAKPKKRLPYETAARLFVAGGKLLP